MEKNILKRVASLALAVVMMLSVLVVVDPQEVSAADKSVKKTSGSETVQITLEDLTNMYNAQDSATYIKFKPAKTGYVTVKMSKNNTSQYSRAYGWVTLCNSKKSALSKEEVFDTGRSDSKYYTFTYGVKKNTTYYFRIELFAQDSYGYALAYPTNVKFTFVKQDKSNKNSKSKAKTIKAGQKVTGVMIAGENKADWYKIKLTKNKIVKLNYSAKSNGNNANTDGIKISFLNSKGKLWKSGSYDNVSRLFPKNGFEFYSYYSNNPSKHLGIKKGTYYVKVERANKTSSGFYTLSWK